MVQYADYSDIGDGRQASHTSSLPHIVYIQSSVRGLDSAFLPFALLKSDPIADFRQYLDGQQQTSGSQKISVSTLRSAWNSLFTQLNTNQLFFLYAWSSVPGASLQVVRMAGLSFSIATPGPLYRRWLTTRPVWHKGELVVWCEAIDMQDIGPEQVTHIVLSEKHMIRLTPELVMPESRLA